MVVSSVYFARSGTGRGVAVGWGVLLGMGVRLGTGANGAVCVAIGAELGDAQAERKNVKRKKARMVLFRMGCILTKKTDL
jgi:hypothetical protein